MTILAEQTSAALSFSLPELAKRANEAHRKAEDAALRTLEHVRDAGEYLSLAKERLPHGEFGRWLEENFQGSQPTASRYMTVYRRWDELQANYSRVHSLSLRAALAELSEPKEKEEPSDDVRRLYEATEEVTKEVLKRVAASGLPLPRAIRNAEEIAEAITSGAVRMPDGEMLPVSAMIPANVIENEYEARLRQRIHIEEKRLRREEKDLRKITVPDDLPQLAERYNLYLCTVRELGEKLEPNSVDFIITDPPYPREFLPVYDDLGEMAFKVLKPGGSLLCMVGQSYLPDILEKLEAHLSYHWTLSYLTPGGQAVQLWERKVNTFWKPLLWFVKGSYEGDWSGDVCKSAVNDNDKDHHHWGQSESGMADIIERFTYPGQVICDPFLGGGTTGVVALKMNRLFVGCDPDEFSLAASFERIQRLEHGS